MSILYILFIATLQAVDGQWNFRLHDAQATCPYSSVTIEDIKDAAWAAKASYDRNNRVDYIIERTGYKINNIVTRQYMGKDIRFLVAEKQNLVIIAFMGTHGKDQLLQEAMSVLKKPEGMAVRIGGKTTRVVHYFWNAFLRLKNDTNAIKSLWNPSKKIIITGHSLGGAFAALFALHALSEKGNLWFNRDSRLITFGEPRVGNEDFAELHDQLIPPARKLRIINEDDMVPHLPPFLLEYRHHSRGLWLRRTEWRVCRRREHVTSCSNSHILTLKWEDHDIKRYIAAIYNMPNKFKACLSIFLKCDTYHALESALNSVCNE